MLTIFIALLVLLYAVGLILLKPSSRGGRLALLLNLINAFGWIVIVLLLPGEGHPPLWLYVMFLFFPLSLVLMPAAAVALWKSSKEGEESKSYVVASGLYVLANFIVLVVIPVTYLVRGVS